MSKAKRYKVEVRPKQFTVTMEVTRAVHRPVQYLDATAGERPTLMNVYSKWRAWALRNKVVDRRYARLYARLIVSPAARRVQSHR